jgi:hypothetical protein
MRRTSGCRFAFEVGGAANLILGEQKAAVLKHWEISRFCRETFGRGKFSLVGVAREKLDCAEMERRGDMQDVEETMASAEGVLC